MFRVVEKIIDSQPWHKLIKFFRANIVTYSPAIFHYTLKKNFPDSETDLLDVWKAREFPAAWQKIRDDARRNIRTYDYGKTSE